MSLLKQNCLIEAETIFLAYSRYSKIIYTAESFLNDIISLLVLPHVGGICGFAMSLLTIISKTHSIHILQRHKLLKSK